MPAAPTKVSEASRLELRTASSAATQRPATADQMDAAQVELVESRDRIRQVADGVEPRACRIRRNRDARARSRRTVSPASPCRAARSHAAAAVQEQRRATGTAAHQPDAAILIDIVEIE
jgi:hypothetical protein